MREAVPARCDAIQSVAYLENISARFGHQLPTGSGPPLQEPAEYPGRPIHM